MDVFSGDATPETLIAFPTEEENPFRHSFMVAANLNHICTEVPAKGYVLETMVMLATDMDPEPVEDPEARTEEALRFKGQTAWLAEHRQNEAAKKEVEQSPLFYHVKRLIELRKEQKDGSLEVDYAIPEPTDNKLYRRIDEYLSEREKADKGPEDIAA